MRWTIGSGPILDVIASVFPVALLIFLMLKRRPMPAAHSLPLAAVTLYFLRLAYFSSDPNLTHAVLLDGFLTAFTPLLIVGGAILLFKTMEYSGAMATVRVWLNTLTSNRVGQLMLVGWSFSFLIEGISGFGTPAALAAPLLVGLGFPPVAIAIFCLIMNSVPVSFGAVGMPTWFGLSGLNLSTMELQQVGFKTALIHSGAALVIPLLALRMVVSTREIRENIGFIYLSVLASVIPYLLLARINVEFPALVGGFLGLMTTVFLTKKHIGLAPSPPLNNSAPPPIARTILIKALFPFWGTILVLLVTRLPHLGLNRWLNAIDPSIGIGLGNFGNFSASFSLVLSLNNILGTDVGWRHAFLYVPSIVPFFLISVICMIIYKAPRDIVSMTWRESYRQLRPPLGAFLGAMIFAKLFMMGGERSCALILGHALAELTGTGWGWASPFLGALGSFFSGSNTVSNLTFGAVQDAVARTLGLDRTTILALQSVGGALGNMVCLHNIVAVCSILGLTRQEGFILKRTAGPALVYGLMAGALSNLV